MKNYGNFFVFFRLLLALTADRERKKKKDKMYIFAIELLDYTKRWKNVKGRFTIGTCK